MQRKLGGCLFFALLCFTPALAHAEDDVSPFQQSENFVLVGTVQSVSDTDDRVVVGGTDDRRYVVDAYGAYITLLGSRPGETRSLSRGMKVRVAG